MNTPDTRAERSPERIWLQPATEDYRDGWTWCWHPIEEGGDGEGCDIEYVRADLAEPTPDTGEDALISLIQEHIDRARATADDSDDRETRAYHEGRANGYGEASSLVRARLRGTFIPEQVQRDAETSRATRAVFEKRARGTSTQEWRPIETAPKNGMRVLAWDGSVVRVVYHHHRHTTWTTEPGAWTFRPTHWMPLPGPPGSEGSSTQEVVGYVVVGWAEGGEVATIFEGYVREDRAALDCEHFNALADGLRYTVNPVHPVGLPDTGDEG